MAIQLNIIAFYLYLSFYAPTTNHHPSIKPIVKYNIIRPMKQRYFVFEHIIQLLILVRPLLQEYLPLAPYLLAIIVLLALKYKTEGFTPLTLAVVVILLLSAKTQVYELHTLHYIFSLLGGLLYFVPLKMYWLPQGSKTVGFQDLYLDQVYHYYQFYPLDTSQPFELTSMRWNYAREIPKMLEYRDYSNKFIKKIACVLLSYADKHQLTVGKGQAMKSLKSMVVSHGKGGTPLFYSSLMMHFAGNGYRVGGVQHSQKMRTGLGNKEEIKKFREGEVKVRAQEMVKAVEKLENEEMVLMGHSYGCATVLMAYYLLPQALKSKISHLILLDPWLFPLPDEVITQSLVLPVLILANQDFIHNKDAYLRNRNFISIHKAVEYVIWAGAHHLHQTDVGFINGNLLGMVKNSSLSKQQLQLNIEAIEKFIRGEQVEGSFGGRDLGRDYEPKYYHVQNLGVW